MAAFLDLFAGFPVVAPFAQQLGATPFGVSLITGAYSAANLLGNLGAGVVLDRWGRKSSLLIGLWASALVVLLQAFVTNPDQFLALRLLHGLATAVLSPGAFALIGDAAAPERRARAMGLAGVFIAIAAVTAPPLAGIGMDRFGAGAVFIAVAAIMAIVAIAFGFLAREPDVPDRAPALDLRKLTALIRRPDLQVAYFAILALTIGLGTLVQQLPIVLVGRGEGARASGTAFSVYAVVALIGMAGPAARLADRYGRHRPLAVGLALIGLSLIGLSFVVSQFGVWATMAVFGLGFGLLFPAATALVADSSAPSERGTAFGVFYAVYSLGTVIGSLASGELAEVFGQQTTSPFFLGGLCALVMAPLVLTLLLRRGTPSTDPEATASLRAD